MKKLDQKKLGAIVSGVVKEAEVKEAVIPPTNLAAATFNYIANTVRENRAADPLYTGLSSRSIKDGLLGRQTHPFVEGIYSSSPLSQAFDPGAAAGEFYGQKLRQAILAAPEAERLRVIQTLQETSPEQYARYLMDSQAKPAIKSLAGESAENVGKYIGSAVDAAALDQAGRSVAGNIAERVSPSLRPIAEDVGGAVAAQMEPMVDITKSLSKNITRRGAEELADYISNEGSEQIVRSFGLDRSLQFPAEMRRVHSALQGMDPSDILALVSKEAPKSTLSKGAQRALFHAGGVAGGLVHLGTGGVGLGAFDSTGPVGASIYREAINKIDKESERFKNLPQHVKDKLMPPVEKQDWLLKKPLPTPEEVSNIANRTNRVVLRAPELPTRRVEEGSLRKANKLMKNSERLRQARYIYPGTSALADRPAHQAAAQFLSGYLDETSKPNWLPTHGIRKHYGRMTNVSLRSALEPLHLLAQVLPEQTEAISEAARHMHAGTLKSRLMGVVMRGLGRLGGFGRY